MFYSQLSKCCHHVAPMSPTPICAFSKNLHQGQTVFWLSSRSQLGEISFRDLLQDPPHPESPGALPSLPSAALTCDIWARTHAFRGITFSHPLRIKRKPYSPNQKVSVSFSFPSKRLFVLLISLPLEIRVHKFHTWSLSISLCLFLHFLPEGQKWGAGTGWQWAGSRGGGWTSGSAAPRQEEPTSGEQRAARQAPRSPRGAAPSWTRTWLERPPQQEAQPEPLGRCAGRGSARGQSRALGGRGNPGMFRPVCKADQGRTMGPGVVSRGAPPHLCRHLRSSAPRPTSSTHSAPAS